MIDTIKKILEPLKRRVMLMVGRAVILATADDTPLQQVQIRLNAEEILSDVHRVQEYGFTSRPLDGAEAVTVFLGGNRDHGIIIAVDDRRYRLKSLAKGEVALYTDEGDKIHFKRGRIVDIVTETLNIIAGTKVNIETPLLEVEASTKAAFTTPLIETSADIEAGGDISDASGSMQEMRNTYNGHTHDENDNGGPTDPPNQAMN